MPINERVSIVENLKMVDGVILFNDDDNSAIEAIRNLRMLYPTATIIFANGGDRTSLNIPEYDIVDNNLEFAFGVGGFDKANSSSWILQEWKAPKTTRAWGYYRVLHSCDTHTKLKELTVAPKTCLSMQRHEKRAEFWFVVEGQATVYTLNRSSDEEILYELTAHQSAFIQINQWHQLCNESDRPLKLIEIQYGDDCVEQDIERK
jgi:mannose-6-phosphate isomerase-like protein (cupin superfamily)